MILQVTNASRNAGAWRILPGAPALWRDMIDIVRFRSGDFIFYLIDWG